MRRPCVYTASRTRCDAFAGVLPLCVPVRAQTRIPNKGYRVQPAVPDRLKDAAAFFMPNMNDSDSCQGDSDSLYVPQARREQALHTMLSSHANLKNHNKLDRLRIALDQAHHETDCSSDKWKEVYLFLRTTHMCCEVVKESADILPKGQKLAIELEECEEKRVPVLAELPNGMLVLPIFSMETYMDEYFMHANVHQACWFPYPRGGSQREVFRARSFPAAAVGPLNHLSALATVACAPHRVALFLNPGQESSKFITYPEMVELAKIKRTAVRDRRTDLKVRPTRAGRTESTRESIRETYCGGSDSRDHRIGNESKRYFEPRRAPDDDSRAENAPYVFDEHLITVFDTRRMPLRPVAPEGVSAKAQLRKSSAIPLIAQMELHLLLFRYEAITYVYISTRQRSQWRTLLGANRQFTQIDVVCAPQTRPPPDFVTHLRRWSYMRELDSDVHIELTDKTPVPPMRTCSDTTDGKHAADGGVIKDGESTLICIYTPEDGQMLRGVHSREKKSTLMDTLGYNKPLEDRQGMRPFETIDRH